jgi:peroxiredoxin
MEAPETDSHELPDERPQRRREWGGPVRSVIVPVVIVAAIVGGLWWYQSRDDEDSAGGNQVAAGEDTAPEEGRLAPDFQLTALDGSTVRLTDLRGNPVVVNFWATWCEPCKEEMPDLADAAGRHQQEGLVVLGVNVKEDAGSVGSFVEDFGIDFPILLDSNGFIQDRYRANRGLPMSFLIGSDGVIDDVFIGPVTGEDIDDWLARSAGG